MTTYLITTRKVDSPMLHQANSLQETACVIAKHFLNFRGPAEALFAIPSNSPLATMERLRETILCSLEVTKKNQMVWENEFMSVKDSVDTFLQLKEDAEARLNDALSELDSVFENSDHLSLSKPSEMISISGPFNDMGESDMESEVDLKMQSFYKFRNAYQVRSQWA